MNENAADNEGEGDEDFQGNENDHESLLRFSVRHPNTICHSDDKSCQI